MSAKRECRLFRNEPGTIADVRFVYLKGDRDVIRERMEMRYGHYMKAGLLES
jgi:gluconate kinase